HGDHLSRSDRLKRQKYHPAFVQRLAYCRRPFHVFDASKEVRVCHALHAPDGVDELLLHSPSAAFGSINLNRLQLTLAALAGSKRQGATDRLPQPDCPLRTEYVHVRQVRSMA